MFCYFNELGWKQHYINSRITPHFLLPFLRERNILESHPSLFLSSGLSIMWEGEKDSVVGKVHQIQPQVPEFSSLISHLVDCCRVSLICTCPMYLALFPFDEQTCPLSIVSCELSFVSSSHKKCSGALVSERTKCFGVLISPLTKVWSNFLLCSFLFANCPENFYW